MLTINCLAVQLIATLGFFKRPCKNPPSNIVCVLNISSTGFTYRWKMCKINWFPILLTELARKQIASYFYTSSKLNKIVIGLCRVKNLILSLCRHVKICQKETGTRLLSVSGKLRFDITVPMFWYHCMFSQNSIQ